MKSHCLNNEHATSTTPTGRAGRAYRTTSAIGGNEQCLWFEPLSAMAGGSQDGTFISNPYY